MSILKKEPTITKGCQNQRNRGAMAELAGLYRFSLPERDKITQRGRTRFLALNALKDTLLLCRVPVAYVPQ